MYFMYNVFNKIFFYIIIVYGIGNEYTVQFFTYSLYFIYFNILLF